jgi:hypothetical protein
MFCRPETCCTNQAEMLLNMWWFREFMPGPSVGPFHSSHKLLVAFSRLLWNM